MVAGEGPPAAKFHGYMKNREGWILQIDNYFTIRQTSNKQQRLAYIGLCTKGELLERWKTNRYKYTTSKEVKDGMREYDCNHCKTDSTCNEIRDLKQTGTVQKYLNNVDRLNVYFKMKDHHLINIILNRMTPPLWQAMAHYE